MVTVPGSAPVTGPDPPGTPVNIPLVVNPVIVAVTACEPAPRGFN